MIPDNNQVKEHVSFETSKYKYDILMNLRDHEHTILWQKFNVFLGFNTIIIAIIAAVISLQKSAIINPQNLFESYLSPVILFTFMCIFAIAFVCSVFVSRILKGSDYWIDFWEGKLYASESDISPAADHVFGIFVDHPSRVKRELKTTLEEISEDIDAKTKEKVNRLSGALAIAFKKKYISTRKNMERFISAVVCFWGVFFIVTGTLWIYSLVNYQVGQNIMVTVLTPICFILPTLAFFLYIDYKDKQEIQELLNKAKTILN